MRSKIYLIRDVGVVILLLCILFAGSASSGNIYSCDNLHINTPNGNDSSGNHDAIKIAVITDIHFLDSSLVEEGVALSAYEKATGRNVSDLHAVLDTTLLDILNEKPNLLLVTGDITNNGERESHIGIIKKFKQLQNQRIRILVVPGNHDINIPDAKAYRDEKPNPTETVTKEEFANLYAPFGYAEALRRDTASLSYLASVNDSVILLCFDTNRYAEHTTSSVTGGRILPATLDWALAILKEAKEKGLTVLGMMHHGLVEHMPYQAAVFPQYLVEAWEKNADLLADAGLKVVFTGHFHANDITLRSSNAGNTIYDVETASLAQYPFAYRIMELENDVLSINTRFVTSISGKPDLAAEYRDKLEDITRRSAKNRLRGLGLEMSQETLDTLTEVMVKLNLMHVKGDEKPDKELRDLIHIFADQMGGEADTESFQFDFPPEDNRVVIPLR